MVDNTGSSDLGPSNLVNQIGNYDGTAPTTAPTSRRSGGALLQDINFVRFGGLSTGLVMRVREPVVGLD
jgi:hypothetical protein